MQTYIDNLLCLVAFAISMLLAGVFLVTFSDIRRSKRKLRAQIKEFARLIEQNENVSNKLHKDNLEIYQRLDNIDAWRKLNSTNISNTWRK
jgi:hypothetical protein